MYYKYIYKHGHFLAGKDGRVGEHRFNLFEKIGPGTHQCYWCKTKVTWIKHQRTSKGSLVVDHLDNNKQNNNFKNIVPACHSCNVWRDHPDAINNKDLFITKKNGHKARAIQRTCLTCGNPTFTVNADTRSNRGRYCSRICMYNRPR